MKTLFSLFAISFIFIFQQFSFSQNPTYLLEANCIAQNVNTLEWDINMTWTNPGTATNFEYAGGQFFFDFNHLIANGGTLTMTNAGSSLPANMQPRNPTVYTVTTPAQLRWAVNTFPGAGSGYPFPPFTPITIVRARLSTSATTFSGEPFNLVWRSALPNPFTKIFAYVGTTNTDISTPNTHVINFTTCPGTGSISLYAPEDNSIIANSQIDFVWSKRDSTAYYILQVARDNLYSSIVYSDSTLTDTITTVVFPQRDTILFWRVIAKDSESNFIGYSTSRKFSQRTLITVKCVPQAMLIPAPGTISRKDSMKVLIRNSAFPYSIVDSAFAIVDSVNLTGRFWLTSVVNGQYYIVVKHLNSLETWSKDGGEFFSGNYSYDFTSARTQAYGNNMRLKGGKYCFYSGDVDQDGFIDATDLSRIDNGAYDFQVGLRLPEDLDANGVVDAADYSIADNNRQFIGVKSPLTPFSLSREQFDIDEYPVPFVK